MALLSALLCAYDDWTFNVMFAQDKSAGVIFTAFTHTDWQCFRMSRAHMFWQENNNEKHSAAIYTQGFFQYFSTIVATY